MKATELIQTLQKLVIGNGDQEVMINTGMCLCEIDQIDLGGSDEGIIMWAGDLINEEIN